MPKSYRKLTIGFLALVGFCFVLIWYLSWAKVLIVIQTNTEKNDKEYIFDITNGGSSDLSKNMIAGKIVTLELEEERTFPVAGTKTVSAQSDVVGEVLITNNYSKDQALVATTRLASAQDPKKVLVRIKDNITVKAGTQARVKVYAEDPAVFTEIEPMKFIIPGLWQGLWEKIYAENSQKLAVGAVMVGVVSEADLAEAELKLKDDLYKKGSEQIVSSLDQNQIQWVRLTNSEVMEKSANVSVGQEVSEFNFKLKLKVTSVLVDEAVVSNALKERIKLEVGSNKKVSDLDPKSFNYSLENAESGNDLAKIKIVFSVDSLMSGSEKLLDKTELVGKTKEEIINHFSQFAEVKSVDVSFQPVWISKAPNNADKISIIFGTNQ